MSVEAFELAKLDLLLPSSIALSFFRAFRELVPLVEDNDSIERILWRGEYSLTIGFSSGRQAPTMPSEDSTMGQYIVGVNRSARESATALTKKKIRIQVKSTSPSMFSLRAIS